MIVIVALIVIPKRRKPTAAMAWLLAIFLLPFVGILLFLLIGNFRLPKKRRDEQARIDALIKERVGAARNDVADAADWPRWFQRVVAAERGPHRAPRRRRQQRDPARRLPGVDRRDGGRDRHARRAFVHVEFFIVAWDDTTRGFFSAMERAVARGVTVRLLADHISSTRRSPARRRPSPSSIGSA